MPIKAIIFDLNGIFIQGPLFGARFSKEYHVPKEHVLNILFESMDVVRKQNAPSIYSIWKPHLEEWKVNLSEEEFLQYWFSAEYENHEMVDYARQLKKEGYTLYILSNNFKERTTYYEKKFSFLKELFDDIYYSWETGVVKPEKECFMQILDEQHLKPEDCFYVDDSEKNITVAKSLGISAELFKGKETITYALYNHKSQSF